MAFKCLLFLVLLANFSAGFSVVIHFSNAVGSQAPINLRVRSNGYLTGSALLRPLWVYEVEVDNNNNNEYSAHGVYGIAHSDFEAYEPTRDKGHANIYWRADDWGFSFSYDNIEFERDAPWDSE
ncbi:autoinhibited Ca2+-ATPase 1 [Striga asiatica]|uniref:Autoinhibited Ca2+-ATPase 1 n=1 Tax=Striga asiatica TaxID=4170 RepID=A0A5A7QXE2_STRAF|nr:autoinhibited Ca2+-ATPase 1 [Striga asiatica]